MSFRRASSDTVGRPSFRSRSISAASFSTCAESVDAAGALAFRAGAEWAFTFGRAVFAAALGDDIKLISLLHDRVFPQLQLAVGHAFAGQHVVFVAVPRTDEMHFGVGEIEPARGHV